MNCFVQVFRWYNSNKDWLTAPRLPRMMKRLLKRANSLNPSENEDFADEQPAENPPLAVASSPELELKLEQMAAQLNAMALQLNQTQQQLKELQDLGRSKKSEETTATANSNQVINELREVQVRLNATLSAQQTANDENVQRAISSGEQMANRLSRTEKAIQTLKNNYQQHLQNNNSCCNNNANACSSTVSSTAATQEGGGAGGKADGSATSEWQGQLNQKFQWDMEREVEQLKMRLQLTASDVEKSIHAVQMSSEGALRNFSSVFHDGMRSLATVLEDKLSTASATSYEVITNATMAFGEDLQILRQAVSSSTAEIQSLAGQELKNVRALEELRSGNRRHENNIQVLTNGLNDFKVQVQDQMNSVRAHFSQSVTEYYQKIAERQSAMSYHISSIKEELANVKGRGLLLIT